jgi:methyl coenzyme M reductase beta subunit
MKTHLIKRIFAGLLAIMGGLMLCSCTKQADLSEDIVADVISEEYTELLGVDEDSNALIQALNDGFSVQITSVTESEDGYVAECQVSNYDVASAFDQMNLNDTEMTLNDFFEELATTLTSGDKITSKIELTITELDGTYSTAFTEEQFDVASGGLISYYTTWMEGQ